MTELSKQPVADHAERNAFFPSEFSLQAYVAPKTDFAGTQFDAPYTQGKYKVLVVGVDERYLEMENGKLFSTGNHPVEMLLPMLHMHEAGFELVISTLSGSMVKLEQWALPQEDQAIATIYETYENAMLHPHKLSDLLDQVTAADSEYLGVFIPGGHGAFNGLPESKDMQKVFDWALQENKLIITLCHGPAALVAAGLNRSADEFPFKGYEVAVFPDELDEGANIDIGYIPGHLKWLVAERLEALGAKVINKDMTGLVHQDRNLLTGDSPLAANGLGILAANELLKMVK